MSLSKVARGRINVAAQTGEPIPPDWAFDADGNPTTDAKAAMAGTLAPMGDAKGAQLVLMVEILAAALSASCFGFESSSYFSAEGAPPRAGQFMLAINPGPFSTGHFGSRLEDLIAAIEAQPGTRLPGQRRFATRQKAARDGVTLPAALYEELLTLRG
jgi:(2R)-3-sulfolactate dehydrogenase (NADP+)